MNTRDNHRIYESYIQPAQDQTTDDILSEAINHIITALEGHGMLKIVAKPDRGMIDKILKQKHGPFKTSPGDETRDMQKKAAGKLDPFIKGGPRQDREDDDQDDFKTRLLRAIAQAGDADLNMPFEEQEKNI